MNTAIGLIAASLLTGALALFAASMMLGAPPLSFASSLVISWAYVAFASAVAAEAPLDRQAAALAGIAFAAMYSGLNTVVYFVQLTTVAQASASAEIVQALSFNELGSLMFNLDLLGYGLMSISTLFVGLALQPANAGDRVLRLLLIVHAVFAPVCVLLPVLNVFGSMPRAGGNSFGILVLLSWCAYFAPIGVLSVRHFAIRRPRLQPT